jgi:hypothetical protein
MTPPATRKHRGWDGASEAVSVAYETRAGECRRAVLTVDKAEAWSVYDVCGLAGAERFGVLVERLDGANEKLLEALAVQADYVSCQREFTNGEREHRHELPHARRVATRRLRADARHAAALAVIEADRRDDPAFHAQISALLGERAPHQQPATQAA